VAFSRQRNSKVVERFTLTNHTRQVRSLSVAVAKSIAGSGGETSQWTLIIGIGDFTVSYCCSNYAAVNMRLFSRFVSYV
jgi:hypothetical protein